MGEEHNVGFGQGLKVNRATNTPTSPSICLLRQNEGEVGVLVALLNLGPCPKPTIMLFSHWGFAPPLILGGHIVPEGNLGT